MTPFDLAAINSHFQNHRIGPDDVRALISEVSRLAIEVEALKGKYQAECADNDRIRKDNLFLSHQVDLCQRRLCKEGGSR